MTELLEQTVQSLRGLPPETQDALARILQQLVGDDPSIVTLSPEEEASFQTSFAQAEQRRIRDRRADQGGLGQARPVKLRYTLRAAEELDQVLSYIEERSPRGAHHVKERIKTIVRPHRFASSCRPAHELAGPPRIAAYPIDFYPFDRQRSRPMASVTRPDAHPSEPDVTLRTAAKSETPLTPSRSRPSGAGRAG